MGTHARRPYRWIIAALVVAAFLLGASVSTFGSHLFSDVPTLASYHDAVSWLVTRGVTLGCAAGLYCPNDFVTRAQMALFMNRLGKALSPTHIWLEQQGGALDLTTSPFICQTAAFTPTFPMRAMLVGAVSLRSNAAFSARVDSSASINGGVTWFALPSLMWMRAGASTGEWDTATRWGLLAMNAGTSYRFAIQLLTDTGATSVTDWRCEVMVQFTNRNPDGVLPDSMTTAPGRAPGERGR